MPTQVIKTPWGEYAITARGNTAWLHTTYSGVGDNPPQLALTLNGISFFGSMYMKYEMHYDHISEKMIKGWHRDNSQGGMYLRRVDDAWKPITSGMMSKVYDFIIPWACTWLSNNPDFVREGWKDVYQQNLENARKAAIDIAGKLELARVEEFKAQDVYADFVHGKLTPPEPDDMCTCGHIRQSHSNSCQEYPQGSYKRCECMEFEDVKVITAS